MADDGPRLLAGGNPQIPKGDGNEPVQAYIAAMPGWKHDVGRRLDDLIEAAVPGVRRAVRWNTPFYGAPDDEGWFVAYHCYDRYVKVSFFRGSSLDPVPPVRSTTPDVRSLHVTADDLDEEQFTAWCTQAAVLDGAQPF